MADKVIQVVNTTFYKRGLPPTEVYNGQLGFVFFVPNKNHGKDLGVCLSVGRNDEEIVWYSSPDANLELGYALTVHKAQGSEFEIVFLVLPKEKTGLISRELMYTALTRSRKKIVIFLQDDVGPLLNTRSSERSAILTRNTAVFDFRYTSEKYRFNDLIHRTSKGDYVRSKSEVLIANMLWDKNIPYSYEERLFSEDGSEWKLPDFTIKTEDQGTLYWEHLGRLDDPEYVEDWENKKRWYRENGYLDRVITSDELGGFDSKKIEKTILDKIGK